MERRPTETRITDLILRGAAGESIGFLLFAWYSILTIDPHAARHTLAFLGVIAIFGAFVGGGMGSLISLCEYAFCRNMGMIARSLVGVCYILLLGSLLGVFPIKAVHSLGRPAVEWAVRLILWGVLPAMYAGAFASLRGSTIKESAFVTSTGPQSNL